MRRKSTSESDGDDHVGDGEAEQGLDASVHGKVDRSDFCWQPEEEQHRDHADGRPDADQADPDLGPEVVLVEVGSGLWGTLS